MHTDVDAFFAAVEVLDDPSLAGRPVIVGGLGPRGVVAAASYEARRYGVHSAMPMAEARRRCPGAVFLPGRLHRYREVSRALFAVLAELSPTVEALSLDEAVVDLTGTRRLHGEPTDAAVALRRRLEEATGLVCSVGLAATRTAAKIASELAKPRVAPDRVLPGAGVVAVVPGTEAAVLAPMDVRALPGVGPRTAERLAAMGVRTAGDLARIPPEVLRRRFGTAHGTHLAGLARGEDPRPVNPGRPRASISHSETYPVDHTDPARIRAEVVRLATATASRLRETGRAARTVTVTVRYADFRTISRSRTLDAATDRTTEIVACAAGIVAGVDPGAGIRLLGVTVSGLTDVRTRQLSLLTAPDDEDRRDALEAALEDIRRRFGDTSIAPAVAVDGGRVRIPRAGAAPWGPGPGGDGAPDEGPRRSPKPPSG